MERSRRHRHPPPPPPRRRSIEASPAAEHELGLGLELGYDVRLAAD